MTKEEIIEGLKLLEDNMVYFDELLNDKGEYIDVHELLFESIEALEQEPCEDCISRAELLKAVDTWDKFGCDADTKLVPVKDCYVPYIHYDDVVKAIKGMPSIQPKTGHWKKTGFIDKVICDVCNKRVWDTFTDGVLNFQYCPNCGAKMVEPQESEDKE